MFRWQFNIFNRQRRRPRLRGCRTRLEAVCRMTLLAWLNVSNGFTGRGAFGYIMPVLHVPIPIREMLAERDRLRALYEPPLQDSPRQETVTTPDVWPGAFLPISDSGTDVELVVDLRDGDSYGSVGQFDPEGGGLDAPLWPSTSRMLADVADALTLGRPALLDYAREHSFPWSPVSPWEPYVDNGRL
jgi:hypothetical protein